MRENKILLPSGSCRGVLREDPPGNTVQQDRTRIAVPDRSFDPVFIPCADRNVHRIFRYTAKTAETERLQISYRHNKKAAGAMLRLLFLSVLIS